MFLQHLSRVSFTLTACTQIDSYFAALRESLQSRGQFATELCYASEIRSKTVQSSEPSPTNATN